MYGFFPPDCLEMCYISLNNFNKIQFYIPWLRVNYCISHLLGILFLHIWHWSFMCSPNKRKMFSTSIFTLKILKRIE